jgi:outer membrane protein OmpA-like peptidoglycan-associated protein
LKYKWNKIVYRKLLLSTAVTAACAACVSGPSNPPGSPLPTRQEERISDQAIRADQQAMSALQQRLSKLNDGGRRVNDYHFAKAQCWLDFAFHEYHQNDRTSVIEEAMRQSGNLVAEMEKGNKNITLETPIVPTSTRLRPDLWARLEGMKKDRDFTCAAASVACAEVRLVWAGHEYKQTGWRHANPWIGIAEDLIDKADREIKTCPQPAPKVIAKVEAPPPPAPKPAPLPEVVAGVMHFALDKTTIIPASAGILDRVAAVLRNNPGAGVKLIGHTDVRASAAYNRQLAERRVQAVRGYLVAAGVDAGRITTEARGAEALKALGNTVGDHALNRRVELVYTGIKDAQIVFPNIDLQPEK